MAWKTIDRESASRNLAAGGAAVVTHTPVASQVGLPARVRLSITGLASAAQTLTVLYSQGAVLCGQSVDLDVPVSITAYKTDLLLPSLDGGAAVVQISSDNGSDTAVTVTAELAVDTATLDALESRALTQSASAGLVFTPINGETGVRDLIGYLPVPGSASYETEVLATAATWRRLCPAARTTSYYFDAQNGSDANSGLTEALPKQTISAMNTLLAAGNVRLRLKGTWRHAASAGVTMPTGNAITAWPDGSPWRITGCRLEADAGDVTWTLGAGNRYSATIANAAHLQPKSWGIFRYLTVAASTAEVEANSYSYYITGSTVHVNMAGTNPNTIDFELTHTSDYGSLASGITVTGSTGGAMIEGGTFDHAGYGADATGTNQSYGVLMNHTGEAVVYVKDCQLGGNYFHNIGTLSSSGGRTLVENCVAGGCRDDVSTHINFFATSGGNEAIALRCRVVTDRMPRVGMIANNQQAAFFGHTTGGNMSFISVIDCELTADGQDPAQFLGRFNDVPTPTDDPASYIACFHRCRTKPGIGSRTVPWTTNTAYTSCDIAIRPAQSSALCISVLGGKGMFLNGEMDIDWSGINPGASDVYGIHANAVVADVDPHIVNSTIRFRNTASGEWYGFARFNSTTLALDWPTSAGTTSRIINSVFICDSPTTGSVCRLLLGDVLSPLGVFRNNAVYGFALGGTGDYGYSSWIDTVVLQSPVELGVLDNRLASAGSTAYGGYAEVDRLGRPLASPGVSIGPWGQTAGDYDQAWRFSLTPAQQAALEAAGLALAAEDYVEGPTATQIRTEMDSNSTKLASLDTTKLTTARLEKIDRLPTSGTVPTTADLSAATGSDSVLLATTVDTVTSQTVLVLDAGAAADDVYNKQLVLLVDADNSNEIAICQALDYDGDTKTLTLVAAPTFTVAAADAVRILPYTKGLTNVVQHPIDPAFLGVLPIRNSSIGDVQQPIYLNTRQERPRIGLDARKVADSRPAEIQSITVYDSNGAASSGLTVAQPSDLENVGVRDYLLVSKVTGATTAGTYRVVFSWIGADDEEKSGGINIVVP